MFCLNKAAIFLTELVLDIFNTKLEKKNTVLCEIGTIQSCLLSEDCKLNKINKKIKSFLLALAHLNFHL
jgi:hypothetical protein